MLLSVIKGIDVLRYFKAIRYIKKKMNETRYYLIMHFAQKKNNIFKSFTRLLAFIIVILIYSHNISSCSDHCDGKGMQGENQTGPKLTHVL